MILIIDDITIRLKQQVKKDIIESDRRRTQSDPVIKQVEQVFIKALGCTWSSFARNLRPLRPTFRRKQEWLSKQEQFRAHARPRECIFHFLSSQDNVHQATTEAGKLDLTRFARARYYGDSESAGKMLPSFPEKPYLAYLNISQKPTSGISSKAVVFISSG